MLINRAQSLLTLLIGSENFNLSISLQAVNHPLPPSTQDTLKNTNRSDGAAFLIAYGLIGMTRCPFRSSPSIYIHFYSILRCLRCWIFPIPDYRTQEEIQAHAAALRNPSLDVLADCVHLGRRVVCHSDPLLRRHLLHLQHHRLHP